MVWIIIAIIVIAVAVFAYAKIFDGKYETEASIVINKPADEVFAAVADLTTWSKWSPWVVHEPDVKIVFSGPGQPNEVGSFYTWDGKAIGAGKLTHVELVPGSSIRSRLEFARPFKSQSDTGWRFEAADGGGTKATWWMSGQMPFLFRFAAKFIPKMIKMDYTLGLNMLSGMLDPEAEHVKLEIQGVGDVPSMRALSKQASGKMNDLPDMMKEGFTELMAAAKQQTGPPLAAYNNTDMKQGTCDFDMAVQADDEASDAFAVKTFGGGRGLKVRMQGAYRFSNLAFYAAFSHLRMNKHKIDKARPMLQVFENDPDSVASTNELVSIIYLPVTA